MNPDINVDRTLQAWLEEGPSEVPDRVLDEIAAQLDDTPQRKPSRFPRITRGSDTMNRLLIPLAGIAAALVIAVGVYAAVNGWPAVGEPEPDEARFTSERHGYALVLPEGWTVIDIPGTWRPGALFSEDGPGVDTVKRLDQGDQPYILFNSQPVDPGTGHQDWLEIHDPAVQVYFPGWPIVHTETGLMGGEPARFARYAGPGGSNAMEVTTVHGGRAYALRVFGPGGPQWDPRPVVDEWLSRFSFTD
jgi:hypothetical protein